MLWSDCDGVSNCQKTDGYINEEKEIKEQAMALPLFPSISTRENAENAVSVT